MYQMKASLINIRLTSRYSAGSYAFAVKGFCALFSAFKIRSATQFHATLCRANLTLTCPSPKLFVCNFPDSGRHVTSAFQGVCVCVCLSLSLSLFRFICPYLLRFLLLKILKRFIYQTSLLLGKPIS